MKKTTVKVAMGACQCGDLVAHLEEVEGGVKYYIPRWSKKDYQGLITPDNMEVELKKIAFESGYGLNFEVEKAVLEMFWS